MNALSRVPNGTASVRFRTIATRIAVLLLLAGATWVAIMAYDNDRGNDITQKVGPDLQEALQAVAIANPREPDGRGTREEIVVGRIRYYIPDFDQPGPLVFDVEKEMLGRIARDGSLPPLKLDVLHTFMDTTFTDGTAVMEFDGFLGHRVTIYVGAEIPTPHFRNATGAALAP